MSPKPVAFLAVLPVLLALARAEAQGPAVPNHAVSYPQAGYRALNGNSQLRDMVLKGTVRRVAGSDDETGTVTVALAATGQSRLELLLPSGRVLEVRTPDGPTASAAWEGSDGAVHDIAYHNLLAEPAWLSPAFLLSRLLTNRSEVGTDLGEEMQDGVNVRHLNFSQSAPDSPEANRLPRKLSDVDIFLDAGTLLPSSVRFSVHPDDDENVDIPVEIRYSDYRAVNGAAVPFRVQKLINNGVNLELNFTSAATNTGIASSEFELP